MNLDDLTFDAAGLIPAVVQDFFTRDVLTVAYMNRESLAITLAEGRTCFWSRSRQELWRKGETSGNVQYVVEVVKDGPACHLGTDSCFTKQLFKDESVQRFTLDALYALLCERNERRPEGSYTTYLFAEGTEKILKKVGEEATEVIIAAMKGDEGETVYEIADLCYHVLVLMAASGIGLDEVRAELADRHVVDRKEKQVAMSSALV